MSLNGCVDADAVDDGVLNNAGKAPDLLEEILTDLTIKQPVLLIDDPVVNWVAKGEQATIHARLSLPEGTKVDSIKVFYGENSDGKTFKDFVEMTVNKDSYQAVLPLKNPGSYHYFVSANVDVPSNLFTIINAADRILVGGFRSQTSYRCPMTLDFFPAFS